MYIFWLLNFFVHLLILVIQCCSLFSSDYSTGLSLVAIVHFSMYLSWKMKGKAIGSVLVEKWKDITLFALTQYGRIALGGLISALIQSNKLWIINHGSVMDAYGAHSICFNFLIVLMAIISILEFVANIAGRSCSSLSQKKQIIREDISLFPLYPFYWLIQKFQLLQLAFTLYVAHNFGCQIREYGIILGCVLLVVVEKMVQFKNLKNVSLLEYYKFKVLAALSKKPNQTRKRRIFKSSSE